MDSQQKPFDAWSKVKSHLDAQPISAFAYSREIWWCALGANVGAEIDGKHENFRRPALVLCVYNTETLLILPTTSKPKKDRFHYKIESASGTVWVKLTQGRVISSKRLIRRMEIISEADFVSIKEKFKQSIDDNPRK